MRLKLNKLDSYQGHSLVIFAYCKSEKDSHQNGKGKNFHDCVFRSVLRYENEPSENYTRFLYTCVSIVWYPLVLDSFISFGILSVGTLINCIRIALINSRCIAFYIKIGIRRFRSALRTLPTGTEKMVRNLISFWFSKLTHLRLHDGILCWEHWNNCQLDGEMCRQHAENSEQKMKWYALKPQRISRNLGLMSQINAENLNNYTYVYISWNLGLMRQMNAEKSE